MTHRTPQDTALSRRRLLGGAGAVMCTGVLAACAGTGSGSQDPYGGPAGPTTSPTTSPSATRGSASGRPGGDAGPVEGLVRVDDVPVGSAVSATDDAGEPLIISRPDADTVVAFSAVCTHRGCTVAPDGDLLRCPCHGSTFDLATGDNTGGPAPSPLAEFAVRVQGGQVVPS